MTTTERDGGGARSAGPTVQDVLALDSRDVPVSLRDHDFVDQGTADIPKTRYTSPAFAALEDEFVWSRTWQMACMEADIDKPGDHVVYDVGDQSLIVTRTPTGEIRAYHNACLHRGTKLRVEDGRVGSFRCPFHGWRWDLDGSLAEVPAEWDFTHVVGNRAAACLPEARVATWNGFVFVNFDGDAVPFERYAAKLIDHFAHDFGFTGRWKSFHAVKEVGANWKVVMEAFSEAYHVIATHPQIMEFCADANSEYSIWPGEPNVTRFVNAFGIASPHLGDVDEGTIHEAYLSFTKRGQTSWDPLAAEAKARPAVAEVFRKALGGRFGADLSAVSDSEMLDAILYHLFPAFAPWAGIGQSLIYRWRPGRTPDTCFMDVMRLARVPDNGERPAPALTSRLTLEQPWTEAPGMDGLAAVFEQDMSNLPRVQAGLKSTGKPTVSFGRYQEARLRMWHRTIDRYILDGLAAAGRDRSEVEPFLIADG